MVFSTSEKQFSFAGFPSSPELLSSTGLQKTSEGRATHFENMDNSNIKIHLLGCLSLIILALPPAATTEPNATSIIDYRSTSLGISCGCSPPVKRARWRPKLFFAASIKRGTAVQYGS